MTREDPFIADLRRDLNAFDRDLVRRLKRGLTATLRRNPMEVQLLFNPGHGLGGPHFPRSTPPELRAQYNNAVRSAAHAYVEWAATLLVKSGKAPRRRKLPFPTTPARRRIANRAGIPLAILETVLALLPHVDHIPLVGAVHPSTEEVTPDVTRLYEWSRTYDPRRTYCSPVPPAPGRRADPDAGFDYH